MSENTQVVKGGASGGIRGLIEGDQFKAQVAKALPKHLTPDRFIRVACTTLMRVPKLAECDKTSFFNALLSLSQLGLEPDGRRAHLIPFNNTKRGCVECQLIIDYKGLAELAMRSGTISSLHADVVCENDEFAYDRGQVLKHVIDFRKPRGAVYAVYSIARFKDATEKAEAMSVDEVEAIRNRSRAGNSGPWVTDWNEMAKKTVFRRLSKWLPLSPECRDSLDNDDDAIDIGSKSPKISVRGLELDSLPAPASDPTDDIPMDYQSVVKPAEVVKETPAQSTFQVSEATPGNPARTLEAMIAGNGATFDHFVAVLKDMNQIAKDAEPGSIDELPAALITAWVSKPKPLASALKVAKGVVR